MKFLTKPLTFLLLILPFISLAQTVGAVYCIDALSVETYSVTPSDSSNNFSWSSDDSTIVFSNPNALTTTIDWSNVVLGTYTLTFTEESSILAGCSSDQTFEVSIVEGPEVDSIDDVLVCEFSTTIQVSANANGSNLTYDWGQATDESSSVTLDLINIEGPGAGYDSSDIESNQTYTEVLVVTDDNGCSSDESFNVIIVNTPEPGNITND